MWYNNVVILPKQKNVCVCVCAWARLRKQFRGDETMSFAGGMNKEIWKFLSSSRYLAIEGIRKNNFCVAGSEKDLI